MSVIVVPLHEHYRPAHVEHVIGEMIRLGSPRIRAHYDEPSGMWLCFEGTHRLRAALALGVTPTMVVTRWPRSSLALERARYARRRAHIFPIAIVEEP